MQKTVAVTPDLSAEQTADARGAGADVQHT